MLPELTKILIEKWESLFPGISRPINIHYMCIPGSIEGGSTSFLAFIDKHIKPVFITKIHRNINTKEKIHFETSTLKYLEKHGGSVSITVPRLLLKAKISQVWILVFSILEGKPMSILVRNDGTPDLENATMNLKMATQWLAQLHKVTSDNIAEHFEMKKNGVKAIYEYMEIFDLGENEKNYLNNLIRELKILKTNNAFIQHGDFCRHNILISNVSRKKTIGVIDWSDCSLMGIPLYDLFFFITTYYLQARKHSGIFGFIRAFENTFYNDTAYGKIVKEIILQHCNDVGIDKKCIKTLFGLFLIKRAIIEYHQNRRSAVIGNLSRFTIFLSIHLNMEYREAIKAQLWSQFLKAFIKKQEKFNV
jgi:aminoglycoside phosphotransferase